MPPIRSVFIDGNHFEIETISLGKISFVFTAIPANVINKSVATIDAWLDSLLDGKVKFVDVNSVTQNHFYARAHVISKAPLNITTCVSDDPIADNWWQN